MLRNSFSPITCLAIFYSLSATAQSADPILFTVQNKPVYVSEFNYIYSKNNQEKADYSEASLKDYLDLYVRFKLKVQKARDMKLDTLGVLKSELEGYRKQLAKSYLEDREVTDKLVHEAFERMQQDINISHIFTAVDRNASPADTLAAFLKSNNIARTLRNGGNFDQIAADSSDEKTARTNKGKIGFITAMLPDGYYALEKAIYAAKPGDIVGPVRTNVGYHVVRVEAFRPARGEMEVGQILLRKSEDATKNSLVKLRIDSVYQALSNGAKWEELCLKYTEDKTNAAKGGYIGFFGINRYQPSFEEAAFALKNDGAYSAPTETTIGWHIIKRLSARPVNTFDTMKRALTEKVKRDSRSEMARQSMIRRIKSESRFQELPQNLVNWSKQQTDTIFHTFKWKPNPEKPKEVLMVFGNNKSFTIADFEDYCSRTGRDRMRGAGMPVEETIRKMYKNWSDEITLAFEESQLDQKYPEFRSLMKEYEDGILLFEALKINVWDKANTDSVGLEQYFETNLTKKYRWEERAKVSIYTIKTDDPTVLKQVRAMAAKHSSEKVLKKFNKKTQTLSVIEKFYEKGKNKDLMNFWIAGSLTDAKVDAGTKTASFLKVEQIVAPTPKNLQEARGYAVADYQDFLEKKWVEDLLLSYPVQIDEAVFKKLIKK